MQPGNGYCSIEQQNFESEFVAGKPHFRVEIEYKAYNWCGNYYQWYKFVAYPPFREDAKGEKAEQRAIGVARNLIDEVDGTLVTPPSERKDKQGDSGCHRCVYPLVVESFSLCNIHSKRGS